MAQFGELFGGAKLRKESQEEAGTGERFGHGPLNLEAGVIPARPTARRDDTDTSEDTPNDSLDDTA